MASSMDQKSALIFDDEPDIRELVRYNLEQGGFEVIETDDGQEALALVDKERPSLLVLDLMLKRLTQDDAKSGAIFDGYPRTVAQAEALDELLGKLDRRIDRVVSLDVALDDIVERVVGRRVCLDCGQTYHVRYSPPPQNGECISCGGTKIVQRSDDTEEVVRKRYEEYKAKTEPVLAHYETKGVVKGVEGVGSLEEITKRIREAIGVE